MLLLVTVEGKPCIADVGFGGEGLLLPVAFVAGQPVRHYAWTYRIVEGAGHWVLQSLHGGDWIDLYAFTGEAQHLADYQMANYYISTHPDSRFVQTLTVQLPTPSSRKFLHNREFTEDFGTTVTRRMLSDDDELLEVLADSFGLYFPAGTRFRYRETVF
jgi:N-hydroxyarylamine O-acetyltransferase